MTETSRENHRPPTGAGRPGSFTKTLSAIRRAIWEMVRGAAGGWHCHMTIDQPQTP